MEKELAKQKIRELAKKIKESKEDWECESYEMAIAVSIIDYSISHEIVIPLIDYEKYKALSEDEEVERKMFGRRKLRWEDEGNPEYNFMDDFFEAIVEETVTNPSYTLHPDIRELVECWKTE